MSTDRDVRTAAPVEDDDSESYAALRQSADYDRLRSRSRRYLASVSALFLGVFTVTIILAGWFPTSLATKVYGQVDIGLLLAAGLIILPILVATVHLHYAGRRLDPLADRIRDEFERSRQ